MRIQLAMAALMLSGCSTERQILELRRDRLLAIEASANQIKAAIPGGRYDPGRYDVYLALDADIFERVFAEIEGMKIDVDADGRPVTVTLDKFTARFRPGGPSIGLGAKAVDRKSGLTVKLELDTRLVLEKDDADPGALTARIYATRLVPDVRWGPFNPTRYRIVRSMLTLEASKLTDKLPKMKLPLKREFSFGSSARTLNSGRIPLAGDAWMSGDIRLPDTRSAGRFVVDNILFLQNGVHIFASVEGI